MDHHRETIETWDVTEWKADFAACPDPVTKNGVAGIEEVFYPGDLELLQTFTEWNKTISRKIS